MLFEVLSDGFAGAIPQIWVRLSFFILNALGRGSFPLFLAPFWLVLRILPAFVGRSGDGLPLSSMSLIVQPCIYSCLASWFSIPIIVADHAPVCPFGITYFLILVPHGVEVEARIGRHWRDFNGPITLHVLHDLGSRLALVVPELPGADGGRCCFLGLESLGGLLGESVLGFHLLDGSLEVEGPIVCAVPLSPGACKGDHHIAVLSPHVHRRWVFIGLPEALCPERIPLVFALIGHSFVLRGHSALPVGARRIDPVSLLPVELLVNSRAHRSPVLKAEAFPGIPLRVALGRIEGFPVDAVSVGRIGNI